MTDQSLVPIQPGQYVLAFTNCHPDFGFLAGSMFGEIWEREARWLVIERVIKVMPRTYHVAAPLPGDPRFLPRYRIIAAASSKSQIQALLEKINRIARRRHDQINAALEEIVKRADTEAEAAITAALPQVCSRPAPARAADADAQGTGHQSPTPEGGPTG